MIGGRATTRAGSGPDADLLGRHRRLRRAARRAGPRAGRPRRRRRPGRGHLAARPVAAGLHRPGRPRGHRAAGRPRATRCCPTRPPCWPPGRPPPSTGPLATIGKVHRRAGRRPTRSARRCTPGWTPGPPDEAGLDSTVDHVLCGRSAAAASDHGVDAQRAPGVVHPAVEFRRRAAGPAGRRSGRAGDRRRRCCPPGPATTPGVLAARVPDRDAVRAQPDRRLALARRARRPGRLRGRGDRAWPPCCEDLAGPSDPGRPGAGTPSWPGCPARASAARADRGGRRALHRGHPRIVPVTCRRAPRGCPA